MRALAILIAAPLMAACPQPPSPTPRESPAQQLADPCVPDWLAPRCQRARAREACAEAADVNRCTADLVRRVLIDRTEPPLR